MWALLFSAMNAVLDPLFIFPLRMGAAGAALGTALSQTLALVGLLRVLERKVGPRACSAAALCSRRTLRTLAPTLRGYARAGALIFFRTWGKVIAYAYCSRAAAALGAVASAAHLLCFNLGVVLSQLCESIAVATQTLLARAMGAVRAVDADAALAAASGGGGDDGARARSVRAAFHVMRRGALAGALVASALTALTAARPRAVIAGLTTDAAVRAQCHRILAPMLACQLCKGLAYPANGVVMGGLDWQFATFGIWAGSALCIGLVAAAPQPPSLATIWVGLSLFMGSQSLLSIARVVSRTGPWGMLYRGDQEKEK